MKHKLLNLYILCLILIVPICAFAWGIATFHAQQSVAVSSCTVDTDSALIDYSLTTTTNNQAAWLATRFTLASESTITQYDKVHICDGNADTGEGVIEIWGDDGNGTTPRPTSLIDSGTQVSFSAGDILTDCPSYDDNTFTLDTPFSGPAAGNYWVVQRWTGGANIPWAYDAGTGRVCISTDGINWPDCYSNYHYGVTVMGCQP